MPPVRIVTDLLRLLVNRFQEVSLKVFCRIIREDRLKTKSKEDQENQAVLKGFAKGIGSECMDDVAVDSTS